jgi:hypothetical protein
MISGMIREPIEEQLEVVMVDRKRGRRTIVSEFQVSPVRIVRQRIIVRLGVTLAGQEGVRVIDLVL